MTYPPKTDPHVKLEWWIKGRQGDEQEALYAGADHWEATGSRSGVICPDPKLITSLKTFHTHPMHIDTLSSAARAPACKGPDSLSLGQHRPGLISDHIWNFYRPDDERRSWQHADPTRNEFKCYNTPNKLFSE